VITDREVATRVSEAMKKMFSILGAFVENVRLSCSKSDYEAYKKATAQIASRIVMDVMEPLYARHPELAPSNWSDE
jgi:hypothetical protein